MTHDSQEEFIEDWGDSIDDQDSEYWDSYLSGPDDYEIERQYEEEYCQTIEEDFYDYDHKPDKNSITDSIPPISDTDIQKYGYQEMNEQEIADAFLFNDIELISKRKAVNNSTSPKIEIEEPTRPKTILEYLRLCGILFFIISFFTVGFAETFGFSLNTNIIGKIINWTVLLGGLVYDFASIIVLLGLACLALYYLSKHITDLFSKDSNRRDLAWKQTGNSFRQLGKNIWIWVKIICFLVGAFSILNWLGH